MNYFVEGADNKVPTSLMEIVKFHSNKGTKKYSIYFCWFLRIYSVKILFLTCLQL
jgi:hypothetical protein